MYDTLWLDRDCIRRLTLAVDASIHSAERISQLADGDLPDLSNPVDVRLIQGIACVMTGLMSQRVQSIKAQTKDN